MKVALPHIPIASAAEARLIAAGESLGHIAENLRRIAVALEKIEKRP
jgi:type II secretory pathway component PulF